VGCFLVVISRFSKKYISFHTGFIMRYKGGINMERKTLGILALALVGLFAVSFAVAMPFSSSEDKDAMRAAVESGDYEAWKELHIAQASEENFARMTEMHELKQELRDAREAGDDEAVELLMEELKELMPEGRMGQGRMGFGKGFGRGMGQGHEGCTFAN
jgi:hypothetical protein